MRPLRTRLGDIRRRLGIRWEVLERDYLLSWVLAGIDSVPELRRSLVFKGGTALKKCYFGDSGSRRTWTSRDGRGCPPATLWKG